MRAGVVLVAAALAGLTALAAAPLAGPQWPAPPAPARLAFVEELRFPPPKPPSPARKGLWSWVKLLLGLDDAAPAARPQEALNQPTGLCVHAGILYVADPGRPGVLRLDLTSRTGDWLPAPEGASWESPVAVAVSEEGRLYVLDSGLKRIFILDAAGKAVGELRGDPEGAGRPAGLALSDDRVYVSDVLNHRICVYGLEGVFIQAFGRRGAGPGELNYPTYLWFDRKARQLWVTDSGNFRLQWFDAAGSPLGALGQAGNRPGYLARPRGVALDSDGHAYVSDGAFDALELFDRQGRLLLFAGVSGPQPGQFNLPAGVFIDGNDRVFVADTQNARVQVLQYLKEAGR